MLRFILLSILLTIVFRAVSRLLNGVVRGMQGGADPQFAAHRPGTAHVPQRGVQMVRDPQCGTFVVPERAVAYSGTNGERLHFCSDRCRDEYARSRPESAPLHGRTA